MNGKLRDTTRQTSSLPAKAKAPYFRCRPSLQSEARPTDSATRRTCPPRLPFTATGIDLPLVRDVLRRNLYRRRRVRLFPLMNEIQRRDRSPPCPEYVQRLLPRPSGSAHLNVDRFKGKRRQRFSTDIRLTVFFTVYGNQIIRTNIKRTRVALTHCAQRSKDRFGRLFYYDAESTRNVSITRRLVKCETCATQIYIPYVVEYFCYRT